MLKRRGDSEIFNNWQSMGIETNQDGNWNHLKQRLVINSQHSANILNGPQHFPRAVFTKTYLYTTSSCNIS